MEYSIKMGVNKFIYASSGSVYGVKDEPEVTEDLPLVPISVYIYTGHFVFQNAPIVTLIVMSWKALITVVGKKHLLTN